MIKHLYKEEKIKPKYIIFCNNADKKLVYQYLPTEIKTKKNGVEITHKTYIQNTINSNNIDIDQYTHAIIIDENNVEHVIEKSFLFECMFNNIQNSINKEFDVSYIVNVPICITETLEKNSEQQTILSFNKKKITLLSGTLLSIGFFIAKIIMFVH